MPYMKGGDKMKITRTFYIVGGRAVTEKEYNAAKSLA